MACYSERDNKLLSETILGYLETDGMQKRAVNAINEFTRMRVREDGIHRRVMSPLPIGNDELDRSVDDDKPWKIIDKEPDSPAAVSVPFATDHSSIYIKAPRYPVCFGRILSPRFTKDVDELRTYHMDVRQVMSDNAVKDMLAEEDGTFFTGVNTCLVAQDTVVPMTGVVQWQALSGGITRDTVLEGFKILPRTPAHLEVHTFIVNNVTILEFMKWGRDEMGGDYSQDLLKNSWSETTWNNRTVIITIKRDLIPDDSMYLFADEKFFGKSFMLEDTTMHMKKEMFYIEWAFWTTLGSAIGNSAAVGRVDFQ
jgi:hypothetical protein